MHACTDIFVNPFLIGLQLSSALPAPLQVLEHFPFSSESLLLGGDLTYFLYLKSVTKKPPKTIKGTKCILKALETEDC